MKIKKYLVDSMSEAIRIIKQDLGLEAVIVSSRKVRQKGWLGFMKPRIWEVTAAIDKEKGTGAIERSPSDIFSKQDDIKREMAEIKTILKQFSLGQGRAKTSFSDAHLARWEECLLEAGIDAKLITALLHEIKVDSSQDQEKIDSSIYEEIRTRIYSLLTEIYRDGPRKRIFAFIGPTGVGKTTTIAKLGAQFALFHHKKIGIITIDTYRIGAVEQLKIYGDIIEVPVEVVMTPAELREAVDRNSDKDVILIDTSGRSYKNAMQLNVLKGFLDKIPEAEVFLVLSCTTKESDLIKNVENFARLRFSRFIFTKTDETSSLGSILNLTIKLKIPVDYITSGQNVPDDIELMHPGKLAGMVLGGEMSDGPGRKIKRHGSVSLQDI
ncbi:flagellar biosynthesis protein FlhF [Candidatus Formimonas warabiya]|uniref:Flagellar biosynthesis protein FlhF n=1 Tax=Formimonas warabiya TaxID=1761012 RepID=A0A3G1KT95_FORW1|nr:flagellar biosynthesis protein FlhF [Candidatus Formimonas warabiya]ATW25650.1 flagellar biosynthesis protein FlhF [Candidatus Formimonas warabiya]